MLNELWVKLKVGLYGSYMVVTILKTNQKGNAFLKGYFVKYLWLLVNKEPNHMLTNLEVCNHMPI